MGEYRTRIKRTLHLPPSYTVVGGNMSIELIAVLLAIVSYVLSSIGVSNDIVVIALIAVLFFDFLNLEETLEE